MTAKPRTKPINATIASKVLSKQRQLKAVELSATGMTEAGIARTLGVSQPAVHKMLKRADALALAELTDAVEREKLRQSRMLNKLLLEAYESWTESRSRGTADLRFFTSCREVLADLRKVWGVDAPVKTEHQGNPQVLVQQNLQQKYDIPLADLPLELIEQILDHQRAKPYGPVRQAPEATTAMDQGGSVNTAPTQLPTACASSRVH